MTISVPAVSDDSPLGSGEQQRTAPPGSEVGRERRLVGLDGLRAVLCLMVFGLHANVGFLRAAWLTVDAFFVLSGFLITTLLLKEHRKNGRIDIVRFLKSRTLRLLPVLALSVAFAAALYAVLPTHIPGQRPMLKSVLTTLTYTQNVFVGRHPEVPDPLLHTWSLAQEEQFYALWPLLLGVLLLRSRRLAVQALLGLALLSALLLLVTSHGPTPASYFWPWTRSSGLALGAALALALSDAGTRARVTRMLAGKGTGLACLAGFVLPFVLLPHLGLGTGGVLFVGVSSVSITSAVLIAHLALTGDGIANAVLRLPPLVHLGRWSYSFYLVHLPVLIVLRQRLDHTVAFWIAFVMSVLLAAAMHHAVERPLDRVRHRVFAV